MFKENLMSALKKAADCHNSGMSDDDAVIKAAGEYEFNPDQTQRLVETYNTAKTICFYKTAADRSAPFKLASAGAVLQVLFKGESKKAAPDPVLRDYSCYDIPIVIQETGVTGTADEILAKAAAAEAEPLKRVDDHEIGAIYKSASDYRRLAADAEIAAGSAEDDYKIGVYHLAKELEKSGEAAEGLAALYARRTAEAKQVLADLKGYLPCEVKTAAGKMFFTDFDFRNPEPMKLFESLCQTYVKKAQCAAVAATFSKMSEDLVELVKSSTIGPPEEADDFFTCSVRGMVRDGVSVKMSQQRQGDHGGRSGGAGIMDPVKMLTQSMSQGAGSAVKDVTSKTMTEAISNDSASKALTERAKNLHRKFILEKLMTTDPILRGLPEDDVMGAYQTLVQLAPDVSLNEDVARSILRAATASSGSAIAPYDAKTFVDLDAAIKAQLEQQGGKKKQVVA